MKSKKIITVLILSVLLISPVSAEDITVFSENYHNLYSKWMNGDLDSPGLLEAMNDLERQLTSEPENWETLYWRSRAALVRGQVYLEEKNEELSLIDLFKSQELSMESINMRNNSDSWRLMADAGSAIMLQKGLGYIIKNSSKVQEYAETALELDPMNARASLVIAQYLTNAPAIAGGNKKEGIELLRELSQRNNLNKEDSYYIYLSLSESLQKKREKNEAISSCRKALESYPGSVKALNLLKDLQS